VINVRTARPSPASQPPARRARRVALLAASCLLATAGAAQAQSSVTLGGIVDGSVVMVDTVAKQRFIQSGNYAGSRLWFVGSEDLGGGLKAGFNLELGFFLDTGTFNAPANFRKSLVSLEGNFGRVDLGRDYNPLFSVLVRADPFEGGTLGSATGFQASAGAQANNAVFYTTPKLGGFTAKLMYALGEPATAPNSNGNRQGANAFWTLGPVTAFGAWGRQQTQVGASPTTTADWQALLGAQYFVLGGFVTAMYQTGHNNSGVATYNSNNGVPYANRFSTALVGFRMPVSNTPWSVGASYQRYNDRTASNRDASSLGVGVFYSLSKRTTLYANAAAIHNENGQRFTLADAGRNSYNYTPAAGTTVNPKGLAIGFRHTF
jgi:GBP family porin